jgi:Replication protein
VKTLEKTQEKRTASSPRWKCACGCDGVGESLGIHAKSVHSTTSTPKNTSTTATFDPMAIKSQRFHLQNIVAKILPKSRTAKCLRLRAHGQQIKVWKSVEFDTAHYSGLQTCSSVWACPVCAAKVAERRRAELLSAIAVHKARGGSVHLITLTSPHQRGDVLAKLLEQQSKAIKRFWNDRVTKAVMVEMGYVGQVRALEVTHGRKSAKNNGWHPHFHVLLFTGVGTDSVQQRMDWQLRLHGVWARACSYAELGVPSLEHGLKLDNGQKASSYVTKWGLEDEMTKSHIKKGRAGGETPFDFLRALSQDSSDTQAAALFREFVEAFKGKRQLVWSKGLKKSLAVEDVTDEQLVTEALEKSILLGDITLSQWFDVLKIEARALLLEIAAKRSWYEVTRFLYVIEGAHTGTVIPPGLLVEVREILLC